MAQAGRSTMAWRQPCSVEECEERAYQISGSFRARAYRWQITSASMPRSNECSAGPLADRDDDGWLDWRCTRTDRDVPETLG
jgi:hypothetical protein